MLICRDNDDWNWGVNKCPNGLAFDQEIQTCNWRELVKQPCGSKDLYLDEYCNNGPPFPKFRPYPPSEYLLLLQHERDGKFISQINSFLYYEF